MNFRLTQLLFDANRNSVLTVCSCLQRTRLRPPRIYFCAATDCTPADDFKGQSYAKAGNRAEHRNAEMRYKNVPGIKG